MSVDSELGTYIIETQGPEFRVIQSATIDTIYGQYSEEKEKFLPDINMFVTFLDECEVYTNLEDAWDKASLLDIQVGSTENGINLITDFRDINFQDIKKEVVDGQSEDIKG